MAVMRAYARVARECSCSEGSVIRWYRIVRDEPEERWAELLAAKHKGRTKTVDPEIDPTVWQTFFEMWYCDPDCPDAARMDRLPITMLHRVLKLWCTKNGLFCPSRATLERRVAAQFREWGGDGSDPRPLAPRRSLASTEARFLSRLGLS